MYAKIGMVFQHFELYPHMTVTQNVTLAPPMKVLGISEKEALESAERYLTRVNMWDKKMLIRIIYLEDKNSALLLHEV